MQNHNAASFKERIETYIKDHESVILKDLQTLLAFQTIAEKKDEIEKSLNWFLRRAEELGFRTYKTTTNDVGVVEAGQGEETLGILVHLDVVDIGDPDKWVHPPFAGTISDGSIWGRGTIDDKGAAMICLYGMKALQDLGAAFHRRIWLIVGTSEESIWTDMENYKKEFPCPDYGFSPDGDFPVFNIENGYADVILEFDEREYIKEFGDFNIDAGKDSNTIPSRAVFTANDEERVFEGISAHSSAPEMGDNAIMLLCSALSEDRVRNFASENPSVDSAPVKTGGGYNFSRFVNEIIDGDLYGGKLNLDGEETLWEGQYLGRTTVAPTVLKKNGTKVLLTLNIRHNANLTKEDIENAFDEYKEKYQYDFRIHSFMDGLKVSTRLRPVSVMAETYEDWGYESSFVAAGGTSYAKAMENIVSWGPCFQEDPSCAHQENERISITSLFRAMGIYTDYMYRIVTVKENLMDK